jgi:hypothetical protein
MCVQAKDDPGRFICCSRPNLSYEAFLAQDFSHYAPSPQVPFALRSFLPSFFRF